MCAPQSVIASYGPKGSYLYANADDRRTGGNAVNVLRIQHCLRKCLACVSGANRTGSKVQRRLYGGGDDSLLRRSPNCPRCH